MLNRTLELVFKPSIALATKLSKLFAPEQKPVQGYRFRPRFRTASRITRKVS